MMDEREVVRLWEDTVGDSGEAPTDEELTTFANAVHRLATANALEDAAAVVLDGRHPEGLNTPELVKDRGVFQRHDRRDFARWLRKRSQKIMEH